MTSTPTDAIAPTPHKLVGKLGKAPRQRAQEWRVSGFRRFGAALALAKLSRRLLRRQAERGSRDMVRTITTDGYRQWRRDELAGQLARHFNTSEIDGRDVLDVGCGTGELSMLLCGYGARSVIGVDISASAIERARASLLEPPAGGRKIPDENPAAPAPVPDPRSSTRHRIASRAISDVAATGVGSVRANAPSMVAPNGNRIAHQSPFNVSPSFLLADPPTRLPVHDASADLICCFDVLEHVEDVPALLAEWRRVLRPGGRVWIWWSPWRGPYGHHLRSLIPIPWFHLALSERTIFDACALVYDSLEFVPRTWDIDPVTGARRPNKWRSTRSFHPFLNKLTVAAFRRMLVDAGFTATRIERHGFAGPSLLRRAARSLVQMPWFGETLLSNVVLELVLPRVQ